MKKLGKEYSSVGREDASVCGGVEFGRPVVSG
jgi:hypothetical protein